MLTENEWKTLWQILDKLGNSSEGTWQERQAEFLRRLQADAGSGSEEVMGWFGVEME